MKYKFIKDMKKILFILFIMFNIVCNAQIYSKIKHYDKFDDCIKTENIKTLVNIDEYNEIIIIESKGRKLTEYLIISSIEIGKKDSVVNLVNNVYGYQKNYYCIELKDTANWRNENRKKVKELLIKVNLNFSNERIENIINEDSVIYYLPLLGEYSDLMFFCKYENKYIKEIVDRNITAQYTMQFLDRLFWIKKNDGSRIIYSNN